MSVFDPVAGTMAFIVLTQVMEAAGILFCEGGRDGLTVAMVLVRVVKLLWWLQWKGDDSDDNEGGTKEVEELKGAEVKTFSVGTDKGIRGGGSGCGDDGADVQY